MKATEVMLICFQQRDMRISEASQHWTDLARESVLVGNKTVLLYNEMELFKKKVFIFVIL